LDLLKKLEGKEVEVVSQGIVYKGKLMGASENEVYLQGLNDWIALPMQDITDVRESTTKG
jgi:hypothetical protein